MTSAANFPGLSQELAAGFEQLIKDLQRLQTLWSQYEGLFRDPKDVELLNQTAPGFFAFIQSALLECVVVGIVRILDKPKTRGTDNLTLTYLIDQLRAVNAPVADQLDQRRKAIVSAASALFNLRHKVFAHRDLRVVVDEVHLPVTRKAINDALWGVHQILSDANAEFSADKASFAPIIDPPGSYGTLLQLLRASLKQTC